MTMNFDAPRAGLTAVTPQGATPAAWQSQFRGVLAGATLISGH